MPTDLPALNPALCPLCGRANQCAMTREQRPGAPPAPCWCSQLSFAPELLQRIPSMARDKACVCPGCASAAD